MNIELDKYEAANLLWLIQVALGTHPLDTGDWCGQLFFKLEALGDLGGPNGQDPKEVGKEIRRNIKIAYAAKRYRLARKASHEAAMKHESTPELRQEVECAADDLCALVDGFYRP